MDTFAAQTRAGLSFADWRNMTPARAGREFHQRVHSLPATLRSAAIAWLRLEEELSAEFERWNALTPGRPERVEGNALHPLRGIPYALKDLFDLAGVPTRAGSSFLPEVRPAPVRDCNLVTRLRSLGAAVAAKTHLQEFASGLTGENIHHGDCPHPHFPDRLTGGSSSGSAALVGAGVVPFAIGSDTGGSVRVPGSWCGLFGFRLTPGDEFIRDAFPLSATCDTAGWFTGNAADMLVAWNALVTGRANRPDEPGAGGRSSARPEDSPYPKVRQLRGCHLKMADLVEGFDSEAAAACDRVAAALCPPADAATRAQLLAAWKEARATYSTISMREAFEVHRQWMTPWRERYDPAIWQRYHDAGSWPDGKIAAAHRTKDAIRAAWVKFFESYDYVVFPTVPSGAPRKADLTMDLRLRILTLAAPASVGGLPVLSIPVPLPSGLTAGLQVVAREPASPVFAEILGR